MKNNTSVNSVNELIVPMNKARKISLLLLPIFALMAFDGFFILYDWSSSIPGEKYIKALLVITLVLFLIFLLVRFFQFLRQYISKAPAAILNQDGLWITQYGLIPWENVAAVEEVVIINPLNARREDIRGLGIRLRNPDLVMKKMKKTRLGRALLWQTRHTNTNYHIMLLSLDMSYKEISQFAEQFIDKC